jgi:hypothetical protein
MAYSKPPVTNLGMGRSLSNPLSGPMAEMEGYAAYVARMIQGLPREEQQAAWERFNQQFAPVMNSRDGSLNYEPPENILPPVKYQPRTMPTRSRLRILQDGN